MFIMKSKDQKEVAEYILHEEKLCMSLIQTDAIYDITQLIVASSSAQTRNTMYHKLISLYADKKSNSSLRLRIYHV